MHGPYSQEIWFYAACWSIAFLSSISRSARDADCESTIRGLGLASTSGFFSLGVIGIWVGRVGDATYGPWYFLAIAALVGMLTPTSQDKYVKAIFSKLLKVVVEKEDKNNG